MQVSPTRSTLPHYPFLDSLRGFAALAVVLVHSGQSSRISPLSFLGKICNCGQRGVQLFYVVSAFTIFLSLDSRSSNEKRPIRNFFIRRFFRIGPLFYLMVFINFAFQHLRDQNNAHGPETVGDMLSALTFTNGWSPYKIEHGAPGGWSIAVETTFYLIAPFLFAWVKDLKRATICMLAACAIFPTASFILSRFFHTQIWTEYLWFLSPGIEMPVFSFGIFAYFLWKERGGILHARFSRALSLVLLAASVEIFISAFPSSNATLLWSSFAFVPLIVGLALHSWHALVNRATIWIGRISYSIYLIHFLLVFALARVLQRYFPNLVGTPAGLLLVFSLLLGTILILASLSYRFIEKPGIRLGKLLILRLEGRDQQKLAMSAETTS